MRIVAAIGGSALLPDDEPLTAATQARNAARAARSLARVAAEHDLIVTHGNSPHVGLIAASLAAHGVDDDWPLHQANAASIGLAGHALSTALRDALPDHAVTTVLTHVEVGELPEPSKPIGRGSTDADQGELLVPSPAPRRIVELEAIRTLWAAGHLVVCLGGGGIAVNEDGDLRGVDGVVDKDRTSAMLAVELEADVLVFLMDEDGVYRDFDGSEGSERIDTFIAGEEDLDAFDAGEMRPKLEAALSYVTATGGRAMIGALEGALGLVDDEAGTTVRC